MLESHETVIDKGRMVGGANSVYPGSVFGCAASNGYVTSDVLPEETHLTLNDNIAVQVAV